MTAGALIALLKNADPDSNVRVYGRHANDLCPRVIGVDALHERVTFLVLDIDDKGE